ncbi:MAG TPA: hypothetical protein VKB87_07685 [Myxococcaceae bacterium]|nr:hypothetical protein [Myxococcaceae bacterium]
MRKLVISVLAIGSLLVGSAANAAGNSACKFSDVAKLKEHLEKHVTYPAKGKDIKEACKKEMPDEFTAQERSCVDSKLKSDSEYKNAGDVMKALGVKG